MSDILREIVEYKWQEIAEVRAGGIPAMVEAHLDKLPRPRDFRAALLASTGVSVIAEVKKASPSAGVIRADFDPVAIARQYEQAGAACVSVLTDRRFFQGCLADLQAVRSAISLPVLRKDFIVDRVQLLEARVARADAVLLIAEILPGEELPKLLRQAEELSLQALVELYDPGNLPRVLAAGAKLVGVNNRDLRSFQVRLEHTLDVARDLPADVCLVSESGIRTPADVSRLRAGGVRAILVGETLMRSDDIGATLRGLRDAP